VGSEILSQNWGTAGGPASPGRDRGSGPVSHNWAWAVWDRGVLFHGRVDRPAEVCKEGLAVAAARWIERDW